MTTPEIDRIRAALEHESDDLEWACQPHCMTAVLAHIDAMQAEIERLNADRRTLQATGDHPAPCARHCGAQAFKIEIRGLRKVIGLLDSALKEAFPSGASGVVFERWNAARRIEKETP